ncbi:MAG: MucR family transcriptional regulator [Robiginitomaculum sp.]|nr:MucR family transcriptional regulator [Robiginitomaculum sp.]
MDEQNEYVLELAVDIITAYVSHNTIDAKALPALIESVFVTLSGVVTQDAAVEPLTPAVTLEASITDDYIICLEDGQKYKSLKRHLRTKFDLTPKAYRKKWGLPSDYPMVAKNYSLERSRLAKRTGLGKS